MEAAKPSLSREVSFANVSLKRKEIIWHREDQSSVPVLHWQALS